MVLRKSCLTETVPHGNPDPRALAGARRNGKAIFSGKKATGFSNAEEEIFGGVEVVSGPNGCSNTY
jgi:hypothetical protein